MSANPEVYGVRITEAHICVRVPYKDVGVCRSIPGGRWDSTWKCWIWPLRPETAQKMADAFGSKLLRGNGGGGLAQYIETHCPSAEPRKDHVDPGHIPGLKTKPWKHQREGYALARGLPGAMLAMGMGTGKSLTTIGVLHDSKLSLVICPKAVVPVWPIEFHKHALELPDIILLNRGTSEDKAKRIAKLAASGRRTLVVVNYESAWRAPLSTALLKVPWDTVVLDEVHKIKAPGGKASKFCARLRLVAGRVVGLTGTPMPHSPLDIFAQFRAIAPAIFGTNSHAFRQQYAVSGGYGGHEVIGYKNVDELRAKFLSITYQAGRDVVELPPATHTTIPVEMEPKAAKAYKALARDLYVAIEAGEVTAANAMVKLLRLQQLTGGYLKTDDGALVPMGTEKADALADLIEGMGEEPVVVFCRFRTDIDMVHACCKDLGLKSCELSGQRNDLADWQAGEGQAIAVQIQSGGVGVDLTRARYCIYYSLGYSLGDYLQSLARIHRPGQGRPVSYYHIVVKGTVDEQVYAALESRQDVVNMVIEGLRANHQKEHTK